MRTQIEKLHSAARKYCIERGHYWRKQYFKLIESDGSHNMGSYSDDALKLFPRYNCLDAILIEVEKFTLEDFSSFLEAKELIILAGNTAESIFTRSLNTLAKRVMQQEREAFCEFIHSLNQEQLETIEPLFYRRVLTESASQKLWAILLEKWDIQPKSYWYPLRNTSKNDMMAFQEESFDVEFGIENLRRILQKHDIQHVWTLTESGPEYELTVSVFEPLYCHTGVETYSFSQRADWVIYASHEESITIGGKWLIDEIKANWPHWECFVWKPTLENAQ
ncbi:hypothetical protein [Acetonema longum]|uniref:Uncharacterized protein n=1 Tax=Acetonema longum DSM 6540 TaxID=1009370 RepID=F7NKM3_9FIRM|nr:hypothetical protein [Acetonema longum]EGO63400.1 hypothetical protein ALO_13209 [Acetonema longum DSM 6540]